MMFRKNTEKLGSLIGINRFKGEIDSKGTLRVDGLTEARLSQRSRRVCLLGLL
jgi:hypothetical protein